MQPDLLPLFPLKLVLLPGSPLPLHIFEERYKEMIGEILRTGGEFGVVLATEKGILNIGCTATVEKVMKQYPDGRLDILTQGRRRFEILELDQDRAYLRANVQFFGDEEFDPAPDEVRQRALDNFQELRSVAESKVGEPDETEPLSYQIARMVDDTDFRQILLRLRSETERLKQIIGYVPDYVEKQRRAAWARDVVPKNGHSRWPTNL